MSDGIRDAEGKRPSWMGAEAKAPRGCVDTKPGYGDDLPVTFGQTPDVRHPDTALIDWLERRWRQDNDCPIGADSDGTFFPLCESGTWESGMDLRGAIRASIEAEEANDS